MTGYQYPMKDFIADAQNLVQNPPQQPQRFMPSFEGMNKNNFKTKIVLMDTLSDNDIMILIRDNVDTIVDDILGNDKFYSQLLLNKRFVTIFSRVMCSIPIDYFKRVCCNKVFYDYRCTVENIDEDLWNIFFNLSKTVNGPAVQQLMTLELDEKLACTLAMCRYSSTKEKINAERLNFVIEQQDPNLMKEQMIIWIYEKLFDSVTDLFVAIMLEAYSEEDQSQLGENFMEVYGEVGLAILTILNNMPLNSIRQILMSYYSEWEFSGKYEVRFSLRSLSADYSRISQVVHVLLNEDFYKIP